MVSLHKILTTTALCLAAVGVSSCISATHRVVKAWGQSADEVSWANELGGTTDCLYRVGNELYVQGYRSSGEATMGVENCFGGIWMNPEEAVYEVTSHAVRLRRFGCVYLIRTGAMPNVISGRAKPASRRIISA